MRKPIRSLQVFFFCFLFAGTAPSAQAGDKTPAEINFKRQLAAIEAGRQFRLANAALDKLNQDLGVKISNTMQAATIVEHMAEFSLHLQLAFIETDDPGHELLLLSDRFAPLCKKLPDILKERCWFEDTSVDVVKYYSADQPPEEILSRHLARAEAAKNFIQQTTVQTVTQAVEMAGAIENMWNELEIARVLLEHSGPSEEKASAIIKRNILILNAAFIRVQGYDWLLKKRGWLISPDGAIAKMDWTYADNPDFIKMALVRVNDLWKYNPCDQRAWPITSEPTLDYIRNRIKLLIEINETYMIPLASHDKIYLNALNYYHNEKRSWLNKYPDCWVMPPQEIPIYP